MSSDFCPCARAPASEINRVIRTSNVFRISASPLFVIGDVVYAQRPSTARAPETRGAANAIAPPSALEGIIALRVHLDDSTSANGPLRVLPATHTRGILEHAVIQQLADEIQPVECVTSVGGIVAVRPLAVHASSKVVAKGPRRVVHIEYATDVHVDSDIQLAVG